VVEYYYLLLTTSITSC